MTLRDYVCPELVNLELRAVGIAGAIHAPDLSTAIEQVAVAHV